MQCGSTHYAAVEENMPNEKRLTEASKFLSYVLRHRPDEIGITLDREGWADIAALIAGAAAIGKTLDATLIQEVVATNEKRRFAISEDGTRIRAVQGHSTDTVAISHTNIAPPDFLYHGTATRFLASIFERGLIAGHRHHVHISQDVATALVVANRHGTPTVLSVSSRAMYDLGHTFFQADNGVWLTAVVPAEFIKITDLTEMICQF